MARNEHLDRALREFDNYGVADRQVEQGGKHLKIKWSHEEKSGVIVLPCTPSDFRGVLNSRGDIRRQLQGAGIRPVKHERKKPRLVVTTDKTSLLEHEIDLLKEEDAARTDILVDCAAELTRLSEARSTALQGAMFRMRVNVPPAALGPMLDALVYHGGSLIGLGLAPTHTTIIEAQPKAPELPKPEVIETPKPWYEEGFPEELIEAEALTVPVPVIEKPAPVDTSLFAAPPGANIPLNRQIMLYLQKHGRKTTGELGRAGFTGHGGNASRLGALCYRNQRDGYFDKDEKRRWGLTEVGLAFVEKFTKQMLKKTS